MRWVAAAVVLGVLAGCSRPPHTPIGDAAPKFGSTSKLTTLQGFAEGEWRDKIEFNAFVPIPRSMVAGEDAILVLAPDGKATMTVADETTIVAHGRWFIADDAVSTSFTDIDGFSLADVESRERSRPSGSISDELTTEDRRELVSAACKSCKNLVVSEDGKTLKVRNGFLSKADSIAKLRWLRVK